MKKFTPSSSEELALFIRVNADWGEYDIDTSKIHTWYTVFGETLVSADHSLPPTKPIAETSKKKPNPKTLSELKLFIDETPNWMDYGIDPNLIKQWFIDYGGIEPKESAYPKHRVLPRYEGEIHPSIGNWKFSPSSWCYDIFGDYEGEIPDTIGNWNINFGELFSLFFGYKGKIPDTIGNWKFNTAIIDGLFRGYEGVIPDTIGNWVLYTIQHINMFSGYKGKSIPESIGKWNFYKPNMDYSIALGGMFEDYYGTIPDSIGNWDFRGIYFGSGVFEGYKGKVIPDTIGNWDLSKTGCIEDMFSDVVADIPLTISNWNLERLEHPEYDIIRHATGDISALLGLKISPKDFDSMMKCMSRENQLRLIAAKEANK